MFSRQKTDERASYIRDFVLSANDGLITTFAVVAGSQGAQLTPNVVIILGMANLLADGISMASGNYLALESEIEYKETFSTKYKFRFSLLKHAFITFISFVVAGFIPLVPFIFKSENNFQIAIVMVVISLMGLGTMRALAIKRGFIRSILETAIVGTSAALLAFWVGKALENLIS